MKPRFSRENFTRKNNSFNIILQDGDGNIKIMPLKDIYDAMQQVVNHTNAKHGEAIRHANAKHGEAIRHANTKQAAGNYVKINDRIRITSFIKGCRWLKLKTDGSAIEAGHAGSCGYADTTNYNRSYWKIVR